MTENTSSDTVLCDVIVLNEYGDTPPEDPSRPAPGLIHTVTVPSKTRIHTEPPAAY